MPARSRLIASDRAPILCYVTDRRSLNTSLSRNDLDAFVQTVLTIGLAGVDWIQLREKDLSGRELLWLTRQILRLATDSSDTQRHRVRTIINDRLDIALAERTGGVHLGESSLPVAGAKRLAEMRSQSNDFLIGVSCHGVEAARRAEEDGADYLFFGPVFATPAKAHFGAPQGLDRLAVICDSVSIPVLAIGGITLENATSCMDAGAAGIAAIRLFQQSSDVRSVVDRLQELIVHRNDRRI